MKVMRTWKRDGSVNLMNLTAAVDNLKKTAVKSEIRACSDSVIIRRLGCGEVIETRLAFFKIYNGARYVLQRN